MTHHWFEPLADHMGAAYLRYSFTKGTVQEVDFLVDALGLEAGLVTLDKDGIAMAHRDGRRVVFPTRPRQVYDITGAGDMVMATLGLALAAGAALAWARALGEFGATITFAGNFQGRTQTLPLAIYIAFESNRAAGLVLSIFLLAVSITVLAAVGGRVLASRSST